MFLGGHPLQRERHDHHRNGDQERHPAERGGKPGDDGDWGEDSHTDLEWGEADVGHTVFVESAGLQFGVDHLEQGDTGRDGGGCPAPAEDAALEPVFAEEERAGPGHPYDAEDGIRDLVRSRGLGDVYKRQQGCALTT